MIRTHRIAAAASVLLMLAQPAAAQQDHDAGHDVYKGWQNQHGRDCCHGDDCGQLAAQDERVAGDHYEMKVEGKWCPVKPWMFVSNKTSPDWHLPHACLVPVSGHEMTKAELDPCARLICAMPRARY